MKYKVGDKVRVKKDLIVGKRYGGLVLLDNLSVYRGEIVTITKRGEGYYRVEENGLAWSEEMLEDAPVRLNLTISSGTNYSMPIYSEYDMDAVLNTLEATIREELKPKGKYIPDIEKLYYYVNNFGNVNVVRNLGNSKDEYMLANTPVFRTREEAEDYKLFKEQVAELREPFVVGKDNLYFYYAFGGKCLDYASYSRTCQSVLIFGHTVEEIGNARKILGDDRIKKYLLDIWE